MDYKKLYEKHIQVMTEEYLEENGYLDGLESDYIEGGIYSPELVVGYYVYHYGNDAKKVWEANKQCSDLKGMLIQADTLFENF